MNESHRNLIRARLRENLNRIQTAIDEACRRSGRDSGDVQVIAVTKYSELDVVEELLAIGHHVLGENRPQQLIQRAEQFPDNVSWHLIGQLQRNKVRAVLPYVELIHSVDSLRLLERIDRVAQELEVQAEILLQVNISGEDSKSGFASQDLLERWEAICQHPHLRIRGLMTMAPYTEDEKIIRETFSGLRTLRDQLNAQGDRKYFTELSMGMSHDYEIAVEEGATLVRLGTAIFEGCSEILAS